ncbi:HYR domain-containing protein [Bernardetia sp. MNP-M8]|uniref:HYR domain-containing protein n=1 Tax=Bernardetia sp. MNP-M8 TaxID=3127470 RepID=UPI0030D52F8A
MKKLLLLLKNSILLFILLAISYQIKAQDTTPPVFAMPQNASFDCVQSGQTRVLNYQVAAGDKVDDAPIITATNVTDGAAIALRLDGSGVIFDITPTNSMVITSLDVSPYTNGVAANPYFVEVYYKRGTRFGFENNAAAWTLAANTTISFTGANLSYYNVEVGNLALLAGETYSIWVRGYSPTVPSILASSVTANANIGDANFTTSNHILARGLFSGTVSLTQDAFFLGKINYVLATSTITQIAGLPSGSAFPIGVTTNTFRATDVAGNIATKSFTVTVNEDTQKPTLTAKPNYTRNADAGNCTFTNTNIPNGIAADNCTVASYSYVLTGATTGTVTTLLNQVFNVGTTTVTWTATDTNGNISNSDDFTVTISDNQKPILIRRPSYGVTTNVGNCSYINSGVLAFPNGTATDNCSVASYSYILTGVTTGTITTLANQVFNVGITTVTWTATDTNGNISLSDSFTVTVYDNQLPTLTAKTDFTRNADVGNCNFTNTDIPNGIATDNCSVASYSYTLTGATTGTVADLTNQVFNVGITTITWTATDVNGKISLSDEFTVTVNDNQLPTLTAKTDFTRNADVGNCSFINTDIPNGIATDNCSVTSYSYTLTGATTGTVADLTNQVFNVGITTITWTATDVNGNISLSDDFTVTVNDNQLPLLTAQTDFTRNADVGNCSFVNTDIPNGVASDNCSVASYSYVLTGATTGTVTTLANQVFNVGITTITWTATDINGNISTSNEFTVTVNDNQLPLLTAQTDFTRNADVGNCSFVNTDIPNGIATDNCSVTSYSYTLTGATTGTVADLTNQVFNVGTTTVTWTATDANGNVSLSDDFTVTVSDNQLPLLTAQTDFTRNADIGNCSFVNPAGIGNIPNGSATDNCSVASYSYVLTGATTGTVTTLVNQVFNVGTTTVTWTATDENGNVSLSDDFTVTVSDNQLPILTAKSNYTRNANNGVCNFTNTDIPNGVASDNCSVASYSYILTGATTGTVTTLANQVFNVGTTTVTWTATDTNGNISNSDNFTVTVNDIQLPILTAQANFTRNADVGNCNFTNLIGATNIPNGSAADNCSVASYSYVLTGATTGTVSDLINQVFNVGITTITWTANDINGNTSANDDFTVTVSDTQNPVITCPTNIIVNNDPNVCGAVVNFALPIVSDNCTIASLNQTAGIASGDLYPVGTTTNTFIVTDNSGNTATCSFDVTVNQRYELLYSSASFSEIYPTTSGVLGNTISIKSYACDIFTGTNGEDFVTTGKVNVSNIPAGLTASIIKISDTELAFKLNGSAINNAVADEIENLTVIFNDAAFVGVTAANVITSTKTDLVIRFLDFIPLNLRANSVSTSQINLTWETNAIHRAYRLYRNERFIREFSTTTTSFEDQNLNADTYYSYKLVGIVSQNIETDPSADNEWTFPENPILISVSAVCGNGNATLKVRGSGAIFRVYNQETNGDLLLESDHTDFELPSVSQNTTFYVSVIGIGGKESARTAINIEVQPIFEAKILGENSQISCENTIELTAQEVENATYTWYLNGNNLGLTTQTITANHFGDYQVQITKGVCSFMSEKVTVRLNQNPVAKIQQQNAIKFCQNGTINAVETGQNLIYKWLLNNVVIGNTQSQEVTQSGIYTLQVTTENNCQASTSIEVVVTDIPQIPVLETTQNTICPNFETTISIQNAENGVNYQWFRSGKLLTQTGNSISTSIQGKYQVEAISHQNNRCSVVSNEIEINHFTTSPIYLRLSEDQKSLFLEDIQVSQNEIASVEWYFNGELNTNLGTEFKIIPTEKGYYSAKIINQNGCIIQTRTAYFSTQDIITGEENSKTDMFKIYPNPSTGIFTIHFGTVLLENIEITILDGIGRKIYSTTFEKGSQDFKINLQKMPSGMYMIHFNKNNSTQSKQLIIE